MNGEPKVIPEVANAAVTEIVTRLNVNGGTRPNSADEFWTQMAVTLNKSPTNDIVSNLKVCIAAIGEEWDDDHLEEDESTPSLSAYETLLSWATHRPERLADFEDRSLDDLDEEDDDAIGHLSPEFNTQVPPITTDVQTVMVQLDRGELVLNPEWQRSFVWKPQKMRRFIESMLLGLPIPSFLFYQDRVTNLTYVIDGRQRLETIARFMSQKPRRGSGQIKRCFRTFPAKTEGWQKGEKLNAAAGKYYEDLPVDMQKKVTRTPLVTCTFVDLPSEKLYQIFRRYNTGAVALNANEIRNAVYQASPLHVMLYRMAGEARDQAAYLDKEERRTGETLRDVMRGQKERYGAYGFIGRYFAFRHMSSGSVANATNEFMKEYGNCSSKQLESLRRDFVDTFWKTLDWYDNAFVKPGSEGAFHAFLGTVQMVSTARLQEEVKAGTRSEAAVKRAIGDHWPNFAAAKLQQKQNSTLFWASLKEWTEQLKEASSG